MTTPIYLDPSYAKSFTMYGGDTVPYQTLIWQRFLAQYEAENGHSLDTSIPLSPSVKEAYEIFSQKYLAWDLGAKALTSEINLFNLNDPRYSACMQLVNQLYPNISYVQLKDIWSAFAISAGYWNTPAQGIDLSAPFADYLKKLYQKEQEYTSDTTPIKDPSTIIQNNLWNRFLSIQSISDTYRTASSKETQDAFKQFLQRYNQYGITNEVLLSKNTLPSTTDPDGNAIVTFLHSFYGHLSLQEQTDIWNMFLSKEGYSKNPTSVAPLRNRFINYIQSLRAMQQHAEAATGLSPYDLFSRAILDTIFPSLRQMMQQSEQVVSNYSQALINYGKIQEQYTQMMARVPTISPIADITTSPKTTLQVPLGPISTWNLNKVTFGYDDIALSEVIAWAVTNLMDPNKPLGTTIAFTPVSSNGVNYVGTYGFSLENDPSDGIQKICISFENPNVTPAIPKEKMYISKTDAQGFPMDLDTLISTATTKYISLLETVSTKNPTFLTFMQSHPQALTGRLLSGEIKTITDADGNPIVDTGELDKRTEQNALLGQYISGIRIQRDAINSRLQQLQAILTSSRDAINSISDLWTSILETINNIMHAIFAHSA